MTAQVILHPALRDRLHLEKCIAEKRRELGDAEALAEGLWDGTITWQQFDETLTCPSPQQAAYDVAAQVADDVRRELAELEKQTGEPQ